MMMQRPRDWPLLTHPGLYRKLPGGYNDIGITGHTVNLCEWRDFALKRRWRQPGVILGCNFKKYARDFVDCTCSIGRNIPQNKYNHMDIERRIPAANSGMGFLCLFEASCAALEQLLLISSLNS
jgi:hypothetical protein